MWLLAQQVDTGADPVEWIQYGALGLVIIGLLTGWLWPRPAVDRIIAENERRRQESEKCHEVLLGEVHGLRSEVRQLTEEVRRRERAP